MEKLLLAATVTFSLNVFISLSSHSVPQQSPTARSFEPIQVAKTLKDRSWLDNIFQ